MGENSLWFVAANLFLIAYMRLATALIMACIIASSLGLSSPFNLGRSE